MHRTAFATETRAKLLKYAIALHENAPEPVGIFAIVRAVLFILIKRDRIFDLVRHGVDGHRQLEIAQRFHHGLDKTRQLIAVSVGSFAARHRF